MNSWKPATAGKFEYGASRVTVRVMASSSASMPLIVSAVAVEALGATVDEAQQVAVVTGEVSGALPGVLEGAREDLLATGEGLALADREGPHGGVVVGLEGLGHVGHDLRVGRIGGVDVGQAVVDGVDDLEAVERGVQRRVDVLERVADDGAEVDEVAAGDAVTIGLLCAVGTFVAGTRIVIVVAASRRRTTGRGRARTASTLNAWSRMVDLSRWVGWCWAAIRARCAGACPRVATLT